MRICLVSAEHSELGGIGNSVRRLAATLGAHHEVTLVDAGGLEMAPDNGDPGFRAVAAVPSRDIAPLSFSSEAHLRSAAALEAIEAAYEGEGPEYVEVCDYRAPGLVLLQARRAGHPLLRDARFGVRLTGSAELIALHDGRCNDPAEGRVAELEREQLRLADHLVWPGGETLEIYQGLYGSDGLPAPVRIADPFPLSPGQPAPAPPAPGEPLRLLCVGRLQRLKGVIDLVDACLRLPDDGWELTLVGADTETAPMGQSVQLTVEAMCGEDPRVKIEEPIAHAELQDVYGRHHLLVVPSTFDAYPNVALEAMGAGLPVLATPVGGLTAIVEPGVTGWFADGVGRRSLGRALAGLLEAPGEVERVLASGAVPERFLAITDPELVLDAYDELLSSPAPGTASATVTDTPTVTAVIPYFRCAEYVEEAVGSLLGQAHCELDVLIVNDGSFEPGDEVLDELATDPRVRVVTQLNSGDATARNLGISLSTGDYLMMFDADNILEPRFVERALAMLRADPELAYVTCWLRFVDVAGEPLEGGNGYAPLGNRVLAADDENWDGDTIALFPGSVLRGLGPDFRPNAVMHSDWDLYRRLRSEGRFGAVIPERLARYRIRPGSMLRESDERLHRHSWDEQRNWRRLAQLRDGGGGL